MKRMIAVLLAFLIAIPFASGQAQRTYTQPELDRMLAPIALYPDPLLSQILMASTYPIEVVEAARWSRANARLRGDDAVRAAESQDWDPSVKSLVAFPPVLQRMDENLEWTRSLGDAFLAQQPQVMDTVQQLRRRAQAAGNLQSNEQLRVQQQSQAIYIQPVNPQVVYVPYYDPLVVYGPWWWPAYRPVVWAPWPGYVRVARPGISVSFWWGAPISVSAGFFFGHADWPQRNVRVVQVDNYYYRPPVVVNRTVVVERDHWRHDPQHRRGIEYRAASVRQQFAATVHPQAQPQAQAQRAQRHEERRYERPPGRDLRDSKVLTPQPQRQAAPQPRMPAAAAPQTPRPEVHARKAEERREARHERQNEPRRDRPQHKGGERS